MYLIALFYYNYNNNNKNDDDFDEKVNYFHFDSI